MVTPYKRLSARTNECRPFTIVWALSEGYDPKKGTTHHESVAVKAIQRWIKKRMLRTSDYLDGRIRSTTYISTYGSGKKGVVTPEPAVEYTGWISNTFLADMTNNDAADMLDDLAAYVGKRLGQERVRIMFMDKAWDIEPKKSRR